MTNVLIFKIKKWQAFINQREKHSFYAHVKRNITYFKKKKNNHNCTFPGKHN